MNARGPLQEKTKTLKFKKNLDLRQLPIFLKGSGVVNFPVEIKSHPPNMVLTMVLLTNSHDIENRRRLVAIKRAGQLTHIELLLSKEEALVVLAVAKEIAGRREAA